jgi:hypothetical protein
VEKVISGHSHKHSTSNSVLSAGSKNQKKYVLDTGTSLYACGIWYLTHNKVLDIVMEAMITDDDSEESLSPSAPPTAVDAAMEAMNTDDSEEASTHPVPPTAVDAVMTLLDEDSEETHSDDDSQPGWCSFLVYSMFLT